MSIIPQLTTSSLKFYSKAQVSKSCHVLRFLTNTNESEIADLESANNTINTNNTGIINIPICKFVKLILNINDKPMERFYSPISSDTDKGFVDFLIKAYPQGNDMINPEGIFSNTITNLEQGQTVEMQHSFGNIEYSSNGNFTHTRKIKKKNYTDNYNNTDISELNTNKENITNNSQDSNNNTETHKFKIKRLGLICAGVGIAPMFQLIQKINSSFFDKTAVSLIYHNSNIEDICFAEDLSKYDYSGKISYLPVVDEEISSFAYGKGNLTRSMIADYMPNEKDEESCVLLCGKDEFVKENIKILEDMKYRNYYTFY